MGYRHGGRPLQTPGYDSSKSLNEGEITTMDKPGTLVPIDPFVAQDCTVAAIATGIRVQNLKEMRDRLLTVHPGCLFHHFWGALLRPRFDTPEYRNDFAEWAFHGLHDPGLAERLARVDPTTTRDEEQLRQATLDVIETHLDAHDHVPWARYDRQFHFVRSQMVVFATGKVFEHPEGLGRAVGSLPLESVFFHFVEARRRTAGGEDDLRTWLARWGDEWLPTRERLAAIHPYQYSLHEMRERIAAAFEPGGGGRP